MTVLQPGLLVRHVGCGKTITRPGVFLCRARQSAARDARLGPNLAVRLEEVGVGGTRAWLVMRTRPRPGR